MDSIDVVAMTTVVYRGFGGVTVKKIARMGLMNLQNARNGLAALVPSSATTEIARLQLPFVTATMTAEMDQKKRDATSHAQIWSSSVFQTVGASSTPGFVTVIQIAKTGRMNVPRYVIRDNAIPKLSSRVKMVVVYPNCGCAILTTIAETTRMNRPTSAGKRTALRVGKGAPVDRATGVSLNGCSVTAKTTAETTATSYQNIVPNATLRLNLNVPITDVYQRDGCAILKMTAGTIRTKWKSIAKIRTGSVLNPNSNVKTANAYLNITDAITTMIVLTGRMK